MAAAITVDSIVAKLRARPGRGGTRLSYEEADVLLLLLGKRALRADERNRLQESVAAARLKRIGKGSTADRVEREIERMGCADTPLRRRLLENAA